MPETDLTPESPEEGAGALRRLAAEYGLPFVDAIAEGMLDPALVARVPVEWARSRAMLPVRWQGGLGLLLADPRDAGAAKDLALLLGEDMELIVAPPDLIARSIETCYYSKPDSRRDFMKGMDIAPGGEEAAPARRGDDLLQVAEQAPVTQLVNLIVLEAVKARASDIHFEPFESRLRLRYRVDGRLYEQASPPKGVEPALVSRLKVMGHLDIAEKRLPQDGMAKVRVGDREIDVRVSTMPVAEGERVVLRLLDRDSSLLPLSSLGMGSGTIRSFTGMLRQSHGLVRVTGPTGSGKTTTLYSALQQLDTAQRNVMTIEDPIEYQLPDIGQIQV